MIQEPFYDPKKSYEDNFKQGPFGVFADHNVFKTIGKPKHTFMGQPVYIPFGIASGPLLNGTYVKAALDKGFDIVTYKTVRTTQYASHPWPNILFVETGKKLKSKDSVVAGTQKADLKHLSVTNSFGVPSYNPDFWQPDMRDAVLYAREGQVVIGAFQGTIAAEGTVDTYIRDFRLAAKLVKETGVKIIEVNLSCPNEGSDHLLCFDIDRSKIVIDAIKNEIGETPLIVKIAYFEDDELFTRFVESIGYMVEGIEAINTIPAKVVTADGKKALPGQGRDKSGIGGIGIKWAGIDMTKRLVSLRDSLNMNYTIIGVGGVLSHNEYDEYKHAGADAVMSATGVMWNPYMAIEIKKSADYSITKK